MPSSFRQTVHPRRTMLRPDSYLRGGCSRWAPFCVYVPNGIQEAQVCVCPAKGLPRPLVVRSRGRTCGAKRVKQDLAADCTVSDRMLVIPSYTLSCCIPLRNTTLPRQTSPWTLCGGSGRRCRSHARPGAFVSLLSIGFAGCSLKCCVALAGRYLGLVRLFLALFASVVALATQRSILDAL